MPLPALVFPASPAGRADGIPVPSPRSAVVLCRAGAAACGFFESWKEMSGKPDDLFA